MKSPKALVDEFFSRVWSPPHDINAIDELITEDYEITTAGKLIQGRENFKSWVKEFHQVLLEATNQSLDIFSDEQGEKVVSRWVCAGINNGIFGLPVDQRPVSFTGIAISQIREGKFAACWVERSALELYKSLTT